MSQTLQAARSSAEVPDDVAPQTFADVLRFEWTKLRSLRSTIYTLGAFLAVVVGLGAARAGSAQVTFHDELSPEQQMGFDPFAEITFVPAVFGMLVVAVLGGLTMTGEHATGMIQASAAAVPTRGRLLSAKAVVLGTVVFVAGLISALAHFFVSQAILRAGDVPHVTLGEAATVRALIGVALFHTAAALIALAVGTLIRATAGAITIMIGGGLMVPTILPEMLPERLGELVQNFWPTAAGLRVMYRDAGDQTLLGAWDGLLVMVGFTVALLAVAFAVFRRRDI